jgi:hypothetical protein
MSVRSASGGGAEERLAQSVDGGTETRREHDDPAVIERGCIGAADGDDQLRS